jgi:hypothetical protein
MEGELWYQARDALAGVANLSHLKGGEGLDIYCLNSPHFRLDLRVSYLYSNALERPTYAWQSEADVRRFFDDIVPEGSPCDFNLLLCAHAVTGQTPTGARLRHILDTYVPRIEDNPRHKPISVLVITDGVPSESLGGLGTLEQQLIVG